MRKLIWGIFGALVNVSWGAALPVSSGYSYTVTKKDNHRLHIVRINPKYLKAALVAADPHCPGGERVAQIAQRNKGIVALNGGFFRFDNHPRPKPVGTLVIDGRILSFQKSSQPLVLIREGDLRICFDEPASYVQPGTSLLSGIPLLISRGRIPIRLREKSSPFYQMPHARTALGVTRDKKIIIVVAEHDYSLSNLTFEEVKNILSKNAHKILRRYQGLPFGELTLGKSQKVLTDDVSPEGIQGVTLVQLAEEMLRLGCHWALNLDGGGSSTLYIDGKVVNRPIDDETYKGQLRERLVPDALIFLRR